MNKELFSFLSLFIVLIVGALYYTNTIQSPFISSLNSIKSSFHNSVDLVESTLDKHFFQAQHIEDLENKLLKYEKNRLLLHQVAYDLKDLFRENNSSFKSHPDVALVRTISYEKFGNLNRIWLEVDEYNSSKIYGLIYKELVAGIIIPKNKRALALLNRDIKSSYAVYVGSKLAPGIVHGNNGKNLVVKFIPAWFEIKKGDEVITSGLDEIFFKGLKVGRVLSVTKSQGYQNAIIEPYYHANDPNYFHMIRKIR
jgi:rod shape-determining protein MreC